MKVVTTQPGNDCSLINYCSIVHLCWHLLQIRIRIKKEYLFLWARYVLNVEKERK